MAGASPLLTFPGLPDSPNQTFLVALAGFESGPLAKEQVSSLSG